MKTKVNNIEIGKVFRQLRKNQKISQEKIGKALRLHQTAICRIERGEQELSALELYKISHCFGITIDNFFEMICGGRG